MKQPCKECPFKKTSAPGYLGECTNQPDVFLDSLQSTPNICHLTAVGNIGKSGEVIREGDIEERLCVGHLQFLCNTFKLPRGKDWAAARNAAGKNPKVFDSIKEFIQYHS